MALPPLPPGATLLPPAGSTPPSGSSQDDPYDILTREGFTFTNGYRAPGDADRIRAQGYTPAPNSAHNRGDGVDLEHPTLTPAQQTARLNQLFGGWQGARVIDEGHHRHLQLPGWGAAPGTPGTAHAGIPPLPDGASLIQRGTLEGDNFQPDVTKLQMQTIDYGTAKGDWTPERGEELKRNIAKQNAFHPDGNIPVTDNPVVDHGLAIMLPPQLEEKMTGEQVQQYLKVAMDPTSTADDLRATVKPFGFDLTNADDIIKARKAGAGVNRGVKWVAPKPLDAPQGTVASAERGALDFTNLADEYQAIRSAAGDSMARNVQNFDMNNPLSYLNLAADYLLPQTGESVLNSKRSFGDIVGDKIDLNRARLEQDAKDHYLARMGGQIGAGMMLPATAAANAGQVAKIGAVEGAVTGFGAGEGNPLQRAPMTALGAVAGGTGGYAVGRLGEDVLAPGYRWAAGKVRGEAPHMDPMIDEAFMGQAGPVLNDGVQNAPPTPGARTQPNRSEAMTAEFDAPTLSARVPDRIDIANLPPLPRGATLLDDPQIGKARPAMERLSPEEMAGIARSVNPEEVTPLAPNVVQSLDEFNKIGDGRPLLKAPNERDALASRTIPSPNDLFKSTSRKGPLDLSQRIRNLGGIADESGELSAMGIGNEPRKLDFGNDRGLGKLVNPDGRPLDEMTGKLWEEGWFPDYPERPTPEVLKDALRLEHIAGERVFHPNDQPEVDAFHAALAERGRIETAAQEGAPLVEDRGEVISLDDLVDNAPPTNAYEDRPRLVGKIGNINLAHIESPSDVSRLIQQVQTKVGGFDAARRGAITHEETRLLAEDLGMRPEDILRRRRGQGVNAEQLYAMRAVVQKSRQVVANLAKRAVGGSDQDVAQFRNAWMRHVAIEEQVSGATAEVGRAMSQFRMLSRAGDAKAEAVRAYLKGNGGREAVEDVAQKLVDMMEDPAKASSFMREAAKARTWDKINEVWVNSLLSGPKTHIVNFLGNALVAAYHLPEQALTAGIGAVARTPNRTTMREVGVRAAGMLQGAQDGLKLMSHAWKTGEPLDAVSKVEARNYQAIPGLAGRIIRTPTRALTAADEFWKSINRRAALNAGAFRRAYAGAGTAEQKAQRYADLVNNPDKALRDYSDNEARYYTFQAELGEFGKLAQRASNVGPLKFILPFVRTPANIIKFAGERSVFAPLLGEFRAAIKAGGNARNEALARLTMGSGISGLAASYALDGRISGGGPSDPEEMAALRNTGWQPYSVKVGDQWISYQRFEPISLLVGIAADYADAAESGQATPKELNDIAIGIGAATAKNITSKTWLSGLSDFFDMLSDPDRYGRQYFQRLAGSLAVPAIVAHAASATDDNLREVRTMLDAIKSRVPGLSQNLQERLNVWGEPIKRGSGAGQGPLGSAFSFVSPVYTSSMTKDPVLLEAGRLKAPISMPQRSITIDGQRKQLTPEQFHLYVQLSGRPAKKYLEGVIASPEWATISDDERRDFLKDTLREYRDAARDQLKQMFPDLGGAAPSTALPPLPPGAQLVD